MKTLNRVANWNEVFIRSGEPLSLEIGYLPSGSFSYPFILSNPYRENIRLRLSLNHHGTQLSEQVFQINDERSSIAFQFSVDKHIEGDGFFLHFELLTSRPVMLYLSVNPVYAQHVKDSQPFLFGFDDRLIESIRSYEGVPASKVEKTSGGDSFEQEPGVSVEYIDAYIRAKYFRGFLSLSEAGKQLDHVIYNKFMAPDGSTGFTKWKRKVYRKMVTSIYRRLTRNTIRQAYFVKLYRTYINTNLLSENFNND